jgi:hypothetical protein
VGLGTIEAKTALAENGAWKRKRSRPACAAAGSGPTVIEALESPSKDMTKEAVTAGHYHSDGWNKDYPKIQILTIADLLHGVSVQMPPQTGTFKKAQRVKTIVKNQAMDFDDE